MSFTSYMNHDTNPVQRQEWDLNRPPNMMYYGYGQTMRYHEAEQTMRQSENIITRESEPRLLGEQLYEFEGIAHNKSSEDDWQPWMQRSGIPVAQQRLMDLPDSSTIGAQSFTQYVGSDELDLDNGYQSMPNDMSIYRSHRIDQYQPQDNYT